MSWLAIIQLIVTLLPSLIKAYKELRDLFNSLPKAQRVVFRRRLSRVVKTYRNRPELLRFEMEELRKNAELAAKGHFEKDVKQAAQNV